jgi:hypothetical protein
MVEQPMVGPGIPQGKMKHQQRQKSLVASNHRRQKGREDDGPRFARVSTPGTEEGKACHLGHLRSCQRKRKSDRLFLISGRQREAEKHKCPATIAGVRISRDDLH